MRGSIAAVLDYLDKVDPEAAAVARERYGCLTPWQQRPGDLRPRGAEPRLRANASRPWSRSCRDLLRASGSTTPRSDGEQLPRRGAERAARRGRRALLPRHVLRRRRDAGTCATGTCSRRSSICWRRAARSRRPWSGRTTPISATRATPTWARSRDELNIGQLCRERFGDEAALIGFGTHTGTVAAASDWDGDMEVKRVRPSQPRQLRAAVPRRAACRASCSTSDGDARRSARRAAASRGWSASSASSTGPRPSC